MKPLPHIHELEALATPEQFIREMWICGTQLRATVLQHHTSDANLRDAMDRVPSGNFGDRSSAHWALAVGRFAALVNPVRLLP